MQIALNGPFCGNSAQYVALGEVLGEPDEPPLGGVFDGGLAAGSTAAEGGGGGGVMRMRMMMEGVYCGRGARETYVF